MNQDLPNPPVQTEEDTQQTTQQIQESLDYRDLLSSQIMAEQAKANASKYVMGGLQASGAAQTGVAQSVLSGIQAGYQNTLAQNMNQFAMTQDIRQAEQLSQTQAGAINTATTLLSEPDLTQDEYKYIYDTYYNQMSPQDQQTFKFLYDRKGRELGFITADTGETTTAAVPTEVSDYLFNNFGVSDNIVAFRQNNIGDAFDLETAFDTGVDQTRANALFPEGKLNLSLFSDKDNFVRWTEGVQRGNVANGSVVAVEIPVLGKSGTEDKSLIYHFVVYKNKLYRIPQTKAVGKVTKRFKYTRSK